MPLSTEHVPNKALAGTEAVEVIVSDVRKLLLSSGHFSPYVAYGRLAYKFEVQIDLGNPMLDRQRMMIRSKLADEPVEAFPLIGEEVATVIASREREITSPNVARIEHELPISATYRDQDGAVHERLLKYDPADLPQQAAPIDSVRVEGSLPEITGKVVVVKDKRTLKEMRKSP